MQEQKIIKKAYKFRLYPSENQRKLLELTLNICCILYNNALAERKESYENEKKGIDYRKQINCQN